MGRSKTGRSKNNLLIMIRDMVSHDKKIIWFGLLFVPMNVFTQLIDIYLTATIIDYVLNRSEQDLIRIIFLFAVGKFLISGLLQFATTNLNNHSYKLRMRYVAKYSAKYMQSDFCTIESPEGKNMAQRAKNTFFGFDYRAKSIVEDFPSLLALLLSNVLGLFLYGSLISVINPQIILALAVNAGLSYWFQKKLVKYDHEDKKRYVPIERKIWYLINEAKNLLSAKDIKLFGVEKWFHEVFTGQIRKRISLFVKRGKYQYAFQVLIAVINMVFNGFIYFYLISEFLANNISVAEFVLYFGLITSFSSWILLIIDNIEMLHRSNNDFDDLHRYLDMSEKGEVPNPRHIDKTDLSITFDDVGFSYRGAEEETIRGLSFSIRHGEKIAVVGANGAGKSTMVKLICGLYQPTRGSIKIGNIDLAQVETKELFRLFSVVFQDVYLLPTSIARNITLSDKTDRKKLEASLDMSGFSQKIKRLPNKEETTVLKSVLEGATDLSGGEIQKLALSRALYKGGEIVILDEPTAALDPIAESEMYMKYHALTQGKTSIFISHRLSSTRFCDRIFFLENGVIAECGSHDQLMSLGGKYAKMYYIQSRYYEEDAEDFQVGHENNSAWQGGSAV